MIPYYGIDAGSDSFSDDNYSSLRMQRLMTPFDTEITDRLLSTTRSVRRRLDFDRAVDPDILRECVGLASTFTTAHLLAADEVASLLDIPDDYLQTCLIPVAYLLGDDLKPPTRKDPDKIIAWNRWA